MNRLFENFMNTYNHTMDEVIKADLMIIPPLSIIFQVAVWVYYYCTTPAHTSSIGGALFEAILVSFSGLIICWIFYIVLVAVEALIHEKRTNIITLVIGIIGTILLFLRLKQ